MTVPLVPMPQFIIDWQPWIAGWHTADVVWSVAGTSLVGMCVSLGFLFIDKIADRNDKFGSYLTVFFLTVAILSLIFGAFFFVPVLLAMALALVVGILWGINIAINDVFFSK